MSDRVGPAQFQALFVLALVGRTERPPTAASLARSVLWSSTTDHDYREPLTREVEAMQGVLARLARRGLAERVAPPAGRAQSWRITAAGLRAVHSPGAPHG